MKDQVISVTEAARGFSDLVNRVRYLGQSALLMKNGSAVARLVPTSPAVTFQDFVSRCKPGSIFSVKEAEAFSADLRKGRNFLKPAKAPWD